MVRNRWQVRVIIKLMFSNSCISFQQIVNIHISLPLPLHLIVKILMYILVFQQYLGMKQNYCTDFCLDWTLPDRWLDFDAHQLLYQMLPKFLC